MAEERGQREVWGEGGMGSGLLICESFPRRRGLRYHGLADLAL